MLFICYPTCTVCNRARKWLQKNHIEYTERNIKADRPKYDELKKWHAMSELPLKQFFNTTGMQYKSFGLKDRIAEMNEEEQLRLLASDGMLVRRPIAIEGETIFLGFRESVWAALVEDKESDSGSEA